MYHKIKSNYDLLIFSGGWCDCANRSIWGVGGLFKFIKY